MRLSQTSSTAQRRTLRPVEKPMIKGGIYLHCVPPHADKPQLSRYRFSNGQLTLIFMIKPTTPLAEDGLGSRTATSLDSIRGYDRPFSRVSWGAIFAGAL